MLTDKQKIENWIMGVEDNLSFYLGASKNETLEILKKYIKEEIAFGNNSYGKVEAEWRIEQAREELDILKKRTIILKKGPLYTYLYKDVLSVRLYNILMKNGIVVLNDLEGKTRNDLFKLKGFATKSYNELRDFLRSHRIHI